MRAKQLKQFVGKNITIEGYLVTTKRTSTSRGKQMYFGNFLDYDGNFIDTVHFPPIVKRFPFRGKGIYKIMGKVTEEFDCLNIDVVKMERLHIVEDPRYADSRTAHKIHAVKKRIREKSI